jgi:hypothetical protein
MKAPVLGLDTKLPYLHVQLRGRGTLGAELSDGNSSWKR